jgi:hypothetical protein
MRLRGRYLDLVRRLIMEGVEEWNSPMILLETKAASVPL